jgi:predicted AAA+ superfamily ATPase
MVVRQFWLARFEAAWRRRSVLWLRGARRTGKTCLARSIPGCEYFDCELPSARRQMADPEAFLRERRAPVIALDEVQRLPNPSELLKIAADYFPHLRVLATGSSTLGAERKFRDTLTGRKQDVLMTPMNVADGVDFGGQPLAWRLHHGGLPPFFLAQEWSESAYQEWLDSFWARDIQELFRLERRQVFQRLFELLLAQSGGLFDATRLARDCEASRPTIQNYLGVLEATSAVTVVRPYHTRRSVEILAAPKVYGFDTGFVCAFRGWRELRREDLGVLWEHYVLNEIRSLRPDLSVRYWRDKQQHEVDFVLAPPGAPPLALECKWSAASFEPGPLRSFRRKYPQGANLVVTADAGAGFEREMAGLRVRFLGLADLAQSLPGDFLA